MKFLEIVKQEYWKELSKIPTDSAKLESLTTLIVELSNLEYDKERQVNFEKTITDGMNYLNMALNLFNKEQK